MRLPGAAATLAVAIAFAPGSGSVPQSGRRPDRRMTLGCYRVAAVFAAAIAATAGAPGAMADTADPIVPADTADPAPRAGRVVPGYAFRFPRDHFGHPAFESEWWYYTGNLFTASGRHFGFELTFFRRSRAIDGTRVLDEAPPSAWDLDQVYLTHFAVTDTDNERLVLHERLNRAGPGIAGADVRMRRVWNGNWSVEWRPGDETRPVQVLAAMSRDAALRLVLEPRKPVVVHGRDGVSLKVAGDPRAVSHYLSFTRMAAAGTLTMEGEALAVTGSAWMDHEFFSDYLTEDKIGWDWMSVQLDDGTDLMLFGIRDAQGGYGPDTFGTFVDSGGGARAIEPGGVAFRPGRRWRSDATGAEYPVEWQVEVPDLGLWLDVHPRIDAQEVVTERGILPAYWEGAVRFTGAREGRPLAGVGYLEMTGYAGKLDIGSIGETRTGSDPPDRRSRSREMSGHEHERRSR